MKMSKNLTLVKSHLLKHAASQLCFLFQEITEMMKMWSFSYCCLKASRDDCQNSASSESINSQTIQKGINPNNVRGQKNKMPSELEFQLENDIQVSKNEHSCAVSVCLFLQDC